jgi:hypothetical protein
LQHTQQQQQQQQQQEQSKIAVLLPPISSMGLPLTSPAETQPARCR